VSDVNVDELNEILGRFDHDRKNLIPVLQAIQDTYGYIPPQTIVSVASHTGIYPSEVTGVITFYAQFCTVPKGRNIVRVCRGTACHVRGGRAVLKTAVKVTGIEEGETSEDMRFSLETVACLGACALSPVMVVNKTYYGKLNPTRTEGLLKNLP